MGVASFMERMTCLLNEPRSIPSSVGERRPYEGRDRFPLFVILSLGLHVLLFVLLIGLFAPGRGSEAEIFRKDERMLSRIASGWAVSAARLDPAGKGADFDKVAELLRKLHDRVAFSRDLTDKEKSELLADLLGPAAPGPAVLPDGLITDADLDRLIDGKVRGRELKLSSGATVEVTRSPGPEGRWGMHKLDGKAADRLADGSGRKREGAVQTLDDGRSVLVPTGDAPREVPAEYYFRSSPYKGMAALGADLFTLIRERGNRPAYSDITNRGESQWKTKADERGMDKDRYKVPADGLVVFLHSRNIGPHAPGQKRPPLELDGTHAAEILDGLMELGLEEQLDAFRREYLDRYDWESPALVSLVRDFLYRNMNSVFFVLDDFSTAFDEVEELYYKRPVYDLFASYAGRFPGTRTDAEIRFYLASVLDFERRTLERLAGSRPILDDLVEGRRKPGSVFDPSTKAYVLKLIWNEFTDSAARLRLRPEQAAEWYDNREEEIFTSLLGTGGGTRNRALYALGLLFWRRGQFERAFGTWKSMDASDRGLPRSYWLIIGIMEKHGFGKRARDMVNVRLAAEDAAGKDAVLARHLKYHTWKKRSGQGR